MNEKVHQSTELLKLWLTEEEVYVKDGDTEKLITKIPMYLPNLNLIVMKEDLNTITFLATFDSKEKVHLSISDSLEIDRLCLNVSSSDFIVNQCIRVTDDGNVAFRTGEVRAISRSNDLHLKIGSTSGPFSVRVFKFGSFEFFVNDVESNEQDIEEHSNVLDVASNGILLLIIGTFLFVIEFVYDEHQKLSI